MTCSGSKRGKASAGGKGKKGAAQSGKGRSAEPQEQAFVPHELAVAHSQFITDMLKKVRVCILQGCSNLNFLLQVCFVMETLRYGEQGAEKRHAHLELKLRLAFAVLRQQRPAATSQIAEVLSLHNTQIKSI